MDFKIFIIHCLLFWRQAKSEAGQTNHKFLGIGYNLLTGNPDGGDLDTGGVDPGLLYTRKVFDLSHPLSVAAEGRQSCIEERQTTIFFGTKSYQEKLKTDVSLEGAGIAGIANFAFSLSPRFDRAREETSLEHKVFQDDQITCNLGRQRFAQELAHAYAFTVTENFAASVCALPVEYDKIQYMDFLDSWGTHVTIQVELGTKNISRRESSLADFVEHVTKADEVAVSAGGSYMGFGASLKVDYENFKDSSNYALNFGSYSATLLTGTALLPEPIGLKVHEITEALNPVYWQNTSLLTSHHVCDRLDVNHVTQVRTNIARALSEYAAYKMAAAPSDPELIIPLVWPKGTYGLYKALSGCPSGNFTWLEGWRFQDCEDFSTSNSFSGSLHLAGTFEPHGDILTEFCIKGNPAISAFDLSWPKGDYCILKYGDCPTGFGAGWLQWDDEDDEKNDGSVHSSGYLPDGQYDQNTRIFYCCSLPTLPINLPIDKPFYLLRHSRSCQTVRGMHVVEESVYWDEEFWLIPSHHTKSGGSSPFDDGDREDHRLHFCYYTVSDSPEINNLIVG
ncbi:hypothetical protein BsWGS_29009 [Bradybaena similaris]